jgi:hypothetical protein
MKLIQVDSGKTTRLFWSLIVVVGAVLFLTTDQNDPGIFAAAFVLAVVGLFPFYLWLLGWSHGLPIWPVFCLVNGVGYAATMFQNPEPLAEYTPGEIIIGGMTAAGFVFLGTLVWISMTSRTPKPPVRLIMIEHRQSLKFLMVFLAFGVIFQLNRTVGWIPLPGNSVMILRGIALSLATMGLFVLSFYAGKGLLTSGQKWYLGCSAVLLIMFGLGTLMLAQAAIPFAMVVLGFTLGGNKIPWKIVGIGFLVIALLHPGKYEMRNRYWSGGEAGLRPSNAIGFFGEWIGYGLEEVGGLSGLAQTKTESEESPTSAFERAGTLHMLLRVQKMSPTEVPFLYGLTYEHVPRMLIPRIIDDEKGISHAGNQILSVNYGLVLIDRVNTVSIQWGLVPEAYANFGFLGVGALAVVLAALYSYMARLTVGVPLTSLRFVIGLLIMAAATTADTMGVFVTSQFQGVMAVSIASLFFMKRQMNPFAEQQDLEVKSGKVARWEGGKQGPVSEAQGAENAVTAPRDVGTGGTVRTMPIRTPKRIASWMPRRVRAAVVAQYAAAEEGDQGTGGGGQETAADVQTANGIRQEERQRPRQLAVPYQNYRRYRA